MWIANKWVYYGVRGACYTIGSCAAVPLVHAARPVVHAAAKRIAEYTEEKPPEEETR